MNFARPITPATTGPVSIPMRTCSSRCLAAVQRVKASVPAVVYALDGSNGKELWNSGKTITSFARGGLSGGAGQIYLGTHDGTLYSFGFPIEH